MFGLTSARSQAFVTHANVIVLRHVPQAEVISIVLRYRRSEDGIEKVGQDELGAPIGQRACSFLDSRISASESLEDRHISGTEVHAALGDEPVTPRSPDFLAEQ